MRKNLVQFWTQRGRVSEMREITADSVRWEMQERARDLVGAASRHQKAGIASVAARIGIPASRVKKIMYGLVSRIDAWEADRFRGLHDEIAELRARRAAIEAEIKGVIGGRNGDDPATDRGRYGEGAPEARGISHGCGGSMGPPA